ncbi:cytochrome P450 [Amycolatopsis sp. A1MSW2902]|uniref:cytochrome P450 n=1 Tax=Amycolatopsis sp. A1MSW2902 TaxID=687413 RepID=UPI00307CEE22
MSVPRTMPLDRPVLLDPPPGYAELRSSEPVAKVIMPGGGEAWLFTRYDDVRTIMADTRFGVIPPGTDTTGNPTLAQDGDGHRRLRRLVSRVFTMPRMVGLEPRVRALADELVHAVIAAGPGVDLVAALSRPLPLTVISEILGVRVEDRDEFQTWVEAANALVVPVDDPEKVAEYAALGQELWNHVAALVTDRRAHPGDDMLSDMIRGQDTDSDRLNEAELVVTVITLLTTGYLTTANALSAGVIELATHHRFGELADDPDRIEHAVEEVLRRQTGPGNEALPRWAQVDLELAGTSIRAGDMVLARLEAANHDPARFPDPDRFDPSRTANPHLAFGYGRHHCLGAILARIELRAAVAALAARCPNLTLCCAPQDVPWTGHPFDDGPARIPVAW